MTVESRPSVEVRVPANLREAVAGEKVVRGEGASVGEVFASLAGRYPAFADRLFDEQGQLRKFVNVYLNDEDIRYLGKLEAAVRSGDTVTILPAVAGGG